MIFVWNQRRLRDALLDFNDQYGRPPHPLDWSPNLARACGRPELADKYEHDDIWPHSTDVLRIFGNWDKALISAGFTPNGGWASESRVPAQGASQEAAQMQGSVQAGARVPTCTDRRT